MTCLTCNDTGTITTIVHWSDGDGLAEAQCPDCNPATYRQLTQADYDAPAAVNSELRKIVNRMKKRQRGND